MRMGVVADDVTGANDIGIMFAKMGCLTHIYSLNAGGSGYDLSKAEHADIIELNTNSRLDLPGMAYRKVFDATISLKKAGCKQFFKKTCSVFRGNIGVEFDAMLDALGLEFAVVVLGFPKNGRITLDGIHYVHGIKLEDSEFRHDPTHPMRKSNLVEILQAQTRRKVDLIDHRVISKGPGVLSKVITEKRQTCQYLILDVADQEALSIIASVVHAEPILCGSSALGEELPVVWGISKQETPQMSLPYQENLGILVTAGSLMPQTAAQIAYLKDRKVPYNELLPELIFNEETCQKHLQSLVERLTIRLQSGSDAVFYSTNTPEEVSHIRQIGFDKGLTLNKISRLISESLATVTAEVLRLTGQNRLVVAGGETSEEVCKSLGVYSMQVWKEIQPGLPSCISLERPQCLLVLKSGSFGNPDFFEMALEHLRTTCKN